MLVQVLTRGKRVLPHLNLTTVIDGKTQLRQGHVKLVHSEEKKRMKMLKDVEQCKFGERCREKAKQFYYLTGLRYEVTDTLDRKPDVVNSSGPNTKTSTPSLVFQPTE